MTFNDYPYTNFHELNLDWIIKLVKSLESEIKNFINLNTIKYADPIEWDITSQYEANTVVVDASNGNAYISVQAVPSGVDINNTDYWTAIYNYQTVVDKIEKSISSLESTEYASTDYAIGSLLWRNDILYITTKAISQGSQLIADVNIKVITVESWVNTLINALRDELLDEISDREDADTKLQEQITTNTNNLTLLQNDLGAEINNREASDNEILLKIANTKVYNVLDYDINSSGGADCSTIAQNIIDSMHSGETIYFPTGTYLFTTGIKIDKVINFICDGKIRWGSTSGTCITVSSDTASTMDNTYINIRDIGCASGFGNTGQPSSINESGNIGIQVNRFISAKLIIGRLTGFTKYGLYLNGTGDLGLNSQIILHDYIEVNTTANCGIGIYMRSLDAATNCVEANEFHLIWMLQCYYCLKIDDVNTYEASTSNLFFITAIDNAAQNGLYCNSHWNYFIIAFTSTSIAFDSASSYNTCDIGNNYSTDATVVNNGTSNRITTSMPGTSQAPIRTTITSGQYYTNNFGTAIDCYIRAYATTTGTDGVVDINIGNNQSSMISAVKEKIQDDTTSAQAQTIHFRVPNGWTYYVGSSNATLQYITFVPN